MKQLLALMVLIAGGIAAQQYTKEGELTLPDYRKWVFIGSGLGMSYLPQQAGENPPFTNVFAEPSAYDQFVENGVWPDKAMLVAERRASVTNLSINKTGWAQTGEAHGAELEVKDQSKGGWLFYEFRAGEKTAKSLPKTMVCYSCHEEHAAVDNTFVQFYPSLIETAKKHGTYKER